MVRDDWSVTTSLFPHPLIKSQSFRTAMGAPFALPLYGVNGNQSKSGIVIHLKPTCSSDLSALKGPF